MQNGGLWKQNGRRESGAVNESRVSNCTLKLVCHSLATCHFAFYIFHFNFFNWF